MYLCHSFNYNWMNSLEKGRHGQLASALPMSSSDNVLPGVIKSNVSASTKQR